jgi:Zn-dependent membrane protease YugP
LALYAQFKVQSTFQKYLRVGSSSNLTGAQVARELLDKNQLHNVPVEITPGNLSDHYDPRRRILRLSPEVYHGRSLAALGVAAHETGHAIQHANEYIPLNIRNAVFPVASFGSSLAFPLFFIGLILGRGGLFLMDLGIILFSVAVLFQVLTLPVEFNASSRALQMLEGGGYLSRGQEIAGARKVLSAAALTYLAATAMAVLQLLRLLVLRGSRDD